MKPVHPQTLDSLLIKTDDYFNSASYEQAIESSEKALSEAEKDYGNKSNQYAAALDKRGRLYWIYGEYETAEKYYIQSLEIIKDNTGIKNSLYADVLLDLAQLYSYMDYYDKSEKMSSEKNIMITQRHFNAWLLCTLILTSLIKQKELIYRRLT